MTAFSRSICYLPPGEDGRGIALTQVKVRPRRLSVERRKPEPARAVGEASSGPVLSREDLRLICFDFLSG